MKTLILSLFAFVFSVFILSQAEAGGGGSSDRGSYYCAAFDNGWEEHSGGHDTCGECKSAHGQCDERCYQKTYTCKAEGTDREGNKSVSEGYSDFSESDARNQALNRCSYRSNNCRIDSCSDSERQTSSRSCQ